MTLQIGFVLFPQVQQLDLTGPYDVLASLPGVYVAGQMAGVEGYVESTAAGLVCALMLAQKLAGRDVVPPPATTALGGLLTPLSRSHERLGYQPSNITWAHIPPLEGMSRKVRKRERYNLMAERAQHDFHPWLKQVGGQAAVGSGPILPSLDAPESKETSPTTDSTHDGEA